MHFTAQGGAELFVPGFKNHRQDGDETLPLNTFGKPRFIPAIRGYASIDE